MKKVSDPPIPYLDHIVGNFTDGKTIIIEGMVSPPAQRLMISFQTGKNPTHSVRPDDIALHLMASLLDGSIVRNSCIEGVWGTKESFGHYPLGVGKKFTITIINQRPKYTIKVNDDQFEFKQRLPSSRVNHLAIQGDVKLYSISYETNPSFDRFVPLYDDPPPPYSRYPRQADKDDDMCMLKTALPALAVGTGVGIMGASLLGSRSKPTQSPRQQQQQQQQQSSSWSALGAGAAAVGVLGAVGGILYAISKASSGNTSDDD